VQLANDENSDIKGIVAKISSSNSFLSTKEPYRDPYNISTDKQIETLHQKSF